MYESEKLKQSLADSFDQLRICLNRLESKSLGKMDAELLQRQVDAPVTQLEIDIYKLIGNLNSLCVLEGGDKAVLLSKIDSSIKQIEQK
jgi:hypothetical protein